MTRSVVFVLDRSALIRYANLDGLAVGEMIQIAGEEAGVAGVPAQCFLDAYSVLDQGGRGRLVALVSTPHANVEVLALLAGDVVEVARSAPVVVAEVGGHAVVEARRRDLPLATYQGKAARMVLDDDQVLDLVEPGDG